MLFINLKYTWRNLLRNKTYGAINIGGLAVGLASFIIILLYLNYELSYDKWNPALKRVFKVSLRTDEAYEEQTPAPLAGFLKTKLPEVEAATSIQPAGSIELLMSAGDKKIYQAGSVNADSLFFHVFPYTFLQGNARTALNKPNAMVLTEAVSKKLFGDENPIGKTVRVFNAIDCEVTGVISTPDKPSHLDVQFVWRSPYEQQNMFWENRSYQTYVRTHTEVPLAKLEDKIDRAYYEERLKDEAESFEAFRSSGHQAGLYLDRATDIHNFPAHGASNFSTVTILLLLAALLLISGAINFSNLTIASAFGRAKEVGVRKVLGSSKGQLQGMFLQQTALECTISLGLALLLATVALPYFNQSFGLSLRLWQAENLGTITWQLVLCFVAVLFIAGLYPAVHLSLFKPAKVLKGSVAQHSGGYHFRNASIVLQFVVSLFFITVTLVVSRQTKYMQTKNKGFSGSHVLRITATQQTRDKDFETVRNKLLSIPGIEAVAKTTTVPGDAYVDTSRIAFMHKGRELHMNSVKVSDDYFATLNIALSEGRLLNKSYADQNTRNAVINETAAQQLGAGAIGATITFPYCDTVPVTVVGVVKDFHVAGFENAVQPTVYTIGNNACMFQSGGALLVKLNGSKSPSAVAAIERAWKSIEPDFPIRYSFLDDDFAKLFQRHRRLQQLIWFFTITAIFIAVMGLIALTAFYLARRTKEIGIRKVLGAGAFQLAALLSKDFLQLVLLSVVVAVPITWWASQRWLQEFSYRVTVAWWWFALAAVVVLGISLLAVGAQVAKAARANPVKSLRSE